MIALLASRTVKNLALFAAMLATASAGEQNCISFSFHNVQFKCDRSTHTDGITVLLRGNYNGSTPISWFSNWSDNVLLL